MTRTFTITAFVLFAGVLGLVAAPPLGAQEIARTLPIAAAATASVGKDGKPGVLVVVRVSIDAAPAGADKDKKRSEKVDVQAALYGDDAGKPIASEKVSLGVTLDPSADGYDVLVRLPAPVGPHEVRVTAKSGNRTATSSVKVDVPDFVDAPLAASEMILSVSPADVSGPANVLGDLLSRTPTLRRVFSRAERVTGSVHLHEGGDRTPDAVHVTTRLATDAGQNVATELRSVGASEFGAGRVADYQFALPLGRLTARTYVLSMEFDTGGVPLTRVTRFTIQ